MSKDLRKLTEDSRNNRLAETATGPGYFELNKTPYTYSATLPNANLASLNATNSSNNNHQTATKASQPLKSTVASKENPIKNFKPTPINNEERPATRLEINALELELEERVRLVLDTDYAKSKKDSSAISDFSYQPHKEAMELVREKMMSDLHTTSKTHLGNVVEKEPWLESFIKCECLKVTCDDINSKFTNMLSVSSFELGNVSRKLKLIYKQCFEQMNNSWQTMRVSFLIKTRDLFKCQSKIKSLQEELDNKEVEVKEDFDREINRMKTHMAEEKLKDEEKLSQAEFKIQQMADTIKYLNGIFKNMQSDTQSINNVDLQSKCSRLERENSILAENSVQLEKVKSHLMVYEKKNNELEKTLRSRDTELTELKLELTRRDEAISSLMEKEALRNAEIEKLQKISKMKDQELESIDLKDPATSVLCIKCKKSLDDLSNIRAAVMGDNNNNRAKIVCENFRILLPNLRGKQPHRSTIWLRSAVRCILVSKMKEDTSLFALKGETTPFPAYTYAWFSRDTTKLTGSNLTKMLHLSDEDRWGMYYGIRVLARDNDPEGMVFWSLLDESFSDDGAQFVIYCLSVILSIGGSKMWSQFGSCLNDCGNINVMQDEDESFKPIIWLDIETAKEAIKLILVKALASQITDAIDAVEALKVRPPKEELSTVETMSEEKAVSEEIKSSSDSNRMKSPKSRRQSVADIEKKAEDDESYRPATHINLFLWLRIMLQQIHADQIHRAAAIRLMFETASVGALTPNHNTTENPSHVEYPQFQSICQTLFPHLATTEIATLFAICHDGGKNKINSDVFVKNANRKGYFAHALKLAQLPLLAQHLDTTTTWKTVITSLGDAAELALLTSESKQQQLQQESTSALGTYSVKTEKIIRSKLATMVHRKLALLMPSLKVVIKMAPNKWKSVLQDAIESVRSAINDSHAKMIQKFSQTVDLTTFVPPSKHFIDGIQPFICYRRLIAMTSLVKVLLDNPLLPTEFFSIADVDNSLPSIDFSLYRAETVLSSIEQSILTRSVNSTDSVDALHKYRRYEYVRRTLVARRVQTLYKAFMTKELAIPRSVRGQMSIGYICHNKSKVSVKLFLKNRDIYHEPWYALVVISEIYRYKLLYDMKALSIGTEPIPLTKAIVAYSFEQWGSMELAERGIQDFFLNVRTYRSAIPRIRLFGAFVGDGFELEDEVADVLKSPVAIFTYLNLLLDIHKEWKSFTLKERDIHAPKANKEINALGITIEEEESKEEVIIPDIINENSSSIDSLFPSSEQVIQRVDKKEVWYVDPSVVTKVAQKWTHSQAFLEGNQTVYTDLVSKLKPNAFGQVEVDDFLWITMIQWAKLAVWNVKRISTKAATVETDLISSASFMQSKTSRTISSLPTMRLSELNSIMDYIYPKATYSVCDSQVFISSYVNQIAVNRSVLLLNTQSTLSPSQIQSQSYKSITEGEIPRSKFSKEFEKLLKKNILIDSNTKLFKSDILNEEEQQNITSDHDNNNLNKYKLPIFTLPTIKLGSNPSLLYIIARKSFSAYQSVLTQRLTKLFQAGEPSFASETELGKKLQQARTFLLECGDKFQAPDLESQTDLLYGIDMKSLAFEDVVRIDAKRVLNKKINNDSWNNLRKLYNLISELMIEIGEEFPRDTWQAGVKVHVDKPFVYNIHVKNSLV